MPIGATKRQREADVENLPSSKRRNKNQRLCQFENIGYVEDEWHIIFRTLPSIEGLADHVAAQTVALLNGRGGIICYGARPRGMVYGLSIDRKLEDICKNEIDYGMRCIQPTLEPEKYSVKFFPVVGYGEDKCRPLQVVEIKVSSGDPYMLYDDKFGNAYVRCEKSTYGPLTPHEIKLCTVQQMRLKMTADQKIARMLCAATKGKSIICERVSPDSSSGLKDKKESLKKSKQPVPDNSKTKLSSKCVLKVKNNEETPLPEVLPDEKQSLDTSKQKDKNKKNRSGETLKEPTPDNSKPCNDCIMSDNDSKPEPTVKKTVPSTSSFASTVCCTIKRLSSMLAQQHQSSLSSLSSKPSPLLSSTVKPVVTKNTISRPSTAKTQPPTTVSLPSATKTVTKNIGTASRPSAAKPQPPTTVSLHVPSATKTVAKNIPTVSVLSAAKPQPPTTVSLPSATKTVAKNIATVSQSSTAKPQPPTTVSLPSATKTVAKNIASVSKPVVRVPPLMSVITSSTKPAPQSVLTLKKSVVTVKKPPSSVPIHYMKSVVTKPPLCPPPPPPQYRQCPKPKYPPMEAHHKANMGWNHHYHPRHHELPPSSQHTNHQYYHHHHVTQPHYLQNQRQLFNYYQYHGGQLPTHSNGWSQGYQYYH